MGKQLFGTDGIRGVAGEYPLDPATVYAFGVALGRDVARRRHRAGDPDRRGYARIGTLDRGVGGRRARVAAGSRVRYAGVITTPGVAYLTRTGPFRAGVMISASHNPYRDNGIKVFGHSGFKLPDAEEHEIEQEIFRILRTGAQPAPGAAHVDETLARQYLDFLVSTVASALRRRASWSWTAATAPPTGWRRSCFAAWAPK